MKSTWIWLLGLCGALFASGCGSFDDGPMGGVSAKGDGKDYINGVAWKHIASDQVGELTCNGPGIKVDFPAINIDQDMVGYGFSVASAPGQIQTFEFEIPESQYRGTGAIIALIRADAKYLAGGELSGDINDGYFKASATDRKVKLVYTDGDIPKDHATKLLVGVTLPQIINPGTFVGVLSVKCTPTPAVTITDEDAAYGKIYKATLRNTSREPVFVEPCSAFQWEKRRDDGTFEPAGWANRCYYFNSTNGEQPAAIGRPVPGENYSDPNTPGNNPSSLSIAPPMLEELAPGGVLEIYLDAPTELLIGIDPILPMPTPADGDAPNLSSYAPDNNWRQPPAAYGTFRVKTSYFVGCSSPFVGSTYIWDMNCTMNTAAVSAETISIAAPPPQNGICWFNAQGECVSDRALLQDNTCCQQRCGKISQYYSDTLPLAQSCHMTATAPQCGKAVPGRLSVCFSGCTAWVTDDSAVQPILEDWKAAGCGFDYSVMCPMFAGSEYFTEDTSRATPAYLMPCPPSHGECVNGSDQPNIGQFGSCKTVIDGWQ